MELGNKEWAGKCAASVESGVMRARSTRLNQVPPMGQTVAGLPYQDHPTHLDLI